MRRTWWADVARVAWLILGVSLLGASTGRAAIDFGQLDTFTSGSAAGWGEGVPSPNAPAVVSTGGPAGESDAYLRNVSTGGFGAGGKQIIFNRDQWTGDYGTARVARIEMQLANLGTTPITIRLAFQGGQGFTRYGSSQSLTLPADGVWRAMAFDLYESTLTNLGGADTLARTLGSVSELRILAAEAGPAFNGDTVASTLGIDNIRATGRPGDATLDGIVEFADLVALAQHYNSTSASWADGDFDYDGTVAFPDLVILAQNYGAGSAPTLAAAGSHLNRDLVADWALAQSLASPSNASAVPEPLVGWLACGISAFARLRQRTR